MRKILLFPLFLFACLSLVAQTYVLPSLEIRSEGSLLAPFPKKPVSFPQKAVPDSLLPQIPAVYSLRHNPPKPQAGTRHPYRLELDMDTSVRTSLSFSQRPKNHFLSFWRLDGDFSVPATDYYRSALALGINTRSGEILPSQHQFSFQKSQTAAFTGETYSYSTQKNFESIDLGTVDFNDVRSRLSLEKTSQNLYEESFSSFNLGLNHSHIQRFEGQSFANRIVFQERELGLALQYRAPWLQDWLPRFDLGLMTDFHHILPALDVHKRLIFPGGKYLEMGNKTEIKAFSRHEVSETLPWVYLPSRPRLEMKPLDLYLQAWKIGNGTLLRHAGLGQNLRFSYNQPDVYASESQAFLRQARVFGWELSGEAGLNIKGCRLDQDLALDLQWLKTDTWGVRPYSPRLKAKTQASYALKELDIWTSLNQRWLSQDESGQSLPNVFDLSFGFTWPLLPDLRLSVSLENLFDTKYPSPGVLPESGLGLRLAFRWLPLD